MIRRRSRKGPGALEYTVIGMFLGFMLAGAMLRVQHKNEEVKFISPISEVQATQSAVPARVVDGRPAKLERFFAHYDSPLATLSADFVKYADDYGVDYRIVPAISGAESTFCKNYRPETNNCFGYGPHWPFPTISAGIKKVSWQIGQTDLYKDWQADPTNLSKLARVYCQSDPQTWEVTVKQFIAEIE